MLASHSTRIGGLASSAFVLCLHALHWKEWETGVPGDANIFRGNKKLSGQPICAHQSQKLALIDSTDRNRRGVGVHNVERDGRPPRGSPEGGGGGADTSLDEACVDANLMPCLLASRRHVTPASQSTSQMSRVAEGSLHTAASAG